MPRSSPCRGHIIAVGVSAQCSPADRGQRLGSYWRPGLATANMMNCVKLLAGIIVLTVLLLVIEFWLQRQQRKSRPPARPAVPAEAPAVNPSSAAGPSIVWSDGRPPSPARRKQLLSSYRNSVLPADRARTAGPSADQNSSDRKYAVIHGWEQLKKMIPEDEDTDWHMSRHAGVPQSDIARLRRIRNKLAHGEPVSKREVDDMRRSIEELYGKLYP